MLSRRQFLQIAAVTPLLLRARAADVEKVAPPRVLYSNDTTNILSCASPFRDPKDGFTDEHLRASISEAAGADVHLLQPGLGWIPWWQSKLYSPEDHYVKFLGEHGVAKQSAISKYLLAGGDLVRTITAHCERIGVQPFVSYRLNDGHHVRGLAEALKRKQPTPDMSRHYWENYARYRLGPDAEDWDQGVFNWMIPEVREHKFALIRELCENYAIAGLELDFLRHWNRFPHEGSTIGQRRSVTTDFVKRIREVLDRTARGGRRRTLCIRVPARLDIHDEQGIDLAALAAAGVDLVTLSWSYFAFQDDSVRRAKKLLPHTPVYAEMTHTTLTGKALGGSGTQPYLRTTDEQFYTTAHLAYAQGAAGVSLFNFAYYREHTSPALGPFNEPPFHVLPKLKDRDFLARQPQWYFLTAARRDPILGKQPLPALLERGAPLTFTLEMAPTRHHRREGLLRLRCDEPIADREIEVRFNVAALRKTAHVEKPLPHPYSAWLGGADEFQCFIFPASCAVAGANRVELTVQKGDRALAHLPRSNPPCMKPIFRLLYIFAVLAFLCVEVSAAELHPETRQRAAACKTPPPPRYTEAVDHEKLPQLDARGGLIAVDAAGTSPHLSTRRGCFAAGSMPTARSAWRSSRSNARLQNP